MLDRNGKSVVVRVPMEPHCESNETSPLNQRDNNSNTSPASAVTSEQSIKKPFCVEVDCTRKIGIDFLLLCCVGIPIIILFLFGEPYERGFFCNDESLMHPYQKSTVKHWMLYVFGFIMPLLLILTVELIRGKMSLNNDDRQVKVLSWNVPVCVQNIYKYIGYFLFGASSCQLTTDITKFSIGRLRPHFISMCQPIMNDGTDCKNPLNLHKYIEDFTCSNPHASDKVVKDMRMSFPSANSSFSFFTMVYLILYLQSRVKCKGSNLLKHFFQFVLLMLAWFTSLSRISDYKHHWSDVLAGSILGIFFALIINYCITVSEKKEITDDKLASINHELNLKCRMENEV